MKRHNLNLPYPGYLISFEGIDGSGKTTQVQNLVNFLRGIGKDVTTYREPGGTPLGEEIRTLVKTKEMTDLSELLLYYAARVELLITNVIPDLKAGRIVILDRYIDSSVAYQGSKQELRDKVKLLTSLLPRIHETSGDGFWVNNILYPDTTFYLKVSAETSYQRTTTNSRDGQDSKNDTLPIEFRKKIIDSYEFSFTQNPHRVKTIDAELSQDLVWDEIYSYVEKLFLS